MSAEMGPTLRTRLASNNSSESRRAFFLAITIRSHTVENCPPAGAGVASQFDTYGAFIGADMEELYGGRCTNDYEGVRVDQIAH